jgi:hypothetical protein
LEKDGSRCSADASAKINGNEAELLVADGEGYMCWMAQKLLHNRGKNTRMGLEACKSMRLRPEDTGYIYLGRVRVRTKRSPGQFTRVNTTKGQTQARKKRIWQREKKGWSAPKGFTPM